MKIFISSTYKDLVEHRDAITEVLSRMKLQFSAMEFFGSRTDEPVSASKKEIEECDIMVGVYAWRYGWQPRTDSPSITEEEFRHARTTGKRCLCYVVDELHPWPPIMIDQGEAASHLQRFKSEISTLVRSKFTTPDNLAKQVAADLAREIMPPIASNSFGGLLRLNWDVFSAELQVVLSTAYAQARAEATDGVVATRHIITAMANIPSTAKCLLVSFRDVPIQPLKDNLATASVYEMFGYDKPISSCVLASMNRLLPKHSPSQRLLAIELAVDLLKYGTGSSVADFRHAGIDAKAIDRTVWYIKQIANDRQRLRDALASLNDAEVLHIAYVSKVNIPGGLFGDALRVHVLQNARNQKQINILVGELIRSHPQFVVVGNYDEDYQRSTDIFEI